MKVTIDVPDKYAGLFKNQKALEACFRANKGKFKKFLKFDIVKEQSLEEISNGIIDALSSSTQKMTHSIKMVNKSVNDLKDSITDISDMADSILKSGKLTNALSFLNVALNVANLCVTATGFMMISEHLDEITRELSEVKKDVKKIIQHQEILDQKDVKSLINQYANLLNKEKIGETPSLDDYYDLMDKMSLTIDVIGEFFKEDIGNRKVYLDAISMLMPMYIVTIVKYDRMHYLTYGSFHLNRDSFVKKIEQFTNFEFFSAVQEYVFLEKGLNQREAFDAALAYIAKLNEQRVAIADNVTILQHFKNKKEYEEFEQAQDQIILDYMQNIAEEISGKEKAELLVSAIKQNQQLAYS